MAEASAKEAHMSILYNIFHKKEIAEKQQAYKMYVDKFRNIGIELIYDDVEIIYLEKIYKQLLILLDDNPEIPNGFLAKLYICSQEYYEKMEGIVRNRKLLGSTRWFISNNKLLVSVFISTNCFTEVALKKRESELPIKKGFAPEATLVHEFAHVMEYYLQYCKYNWKENPDIDAAMDVMSVEEIDTEVDCFISKEIEIMDLCRKIILEIGVPREFKTRPIATVGPILGGVANVNYQEMFAEALSQYYCSDKPLPISIRIYEEFSKLKQEYMKESE